MKCKDLLFVRLHVLHHAVEHEIYGQWMIDELARHGYKLSPGSTPCCMRWNNGVISVPASSATAAP